MSVAPKVTIFIPVFNGGRFLLETLQSLAQQTFVDFEVLIGDDGSTDNTVQVAQDFIKTDPRFKLICFLHRGEVCTRNDLLTKITPGSVYLMNHDSDDLSLPTKLERLVTTLDKNPEISGVGCYAEYFGDVGTRIIVPELEWRPELLREKLVACNHLINSTVLARREVFDKTGAYREEFRSTDDYDFWARASKLGFEFMNIPQILHLIRLHQSSVSSKQADRQAELGKIIQEDLLKHAETCIGKQQVSKRFPKISDRLNIMHTVEFYAPHVGGCEQVLQQISERLVKRGHYVSVATKKLPDRFSKEINGVSICEFDVEGSLAYGLKGSEVSRYVNFIKSFPADIVMSYAAQQWATDLALATGVETLSKRVNIIAPCGYSALQDAETLRWPAFREYFSSFLPTYLPHYDASIYHSSTYQDYEYGRKLGLSNMVVIPNGVAEEEFLNKPDFNFRQKYGIWAQKILLCVANFSPGKGQDHLLDMFRYLGRSDCALVLIGNDGGTLSDLKRAGLGLNVVFLENIPRTDTIAAFFASDLFVFASEIECFPLVIMEAKAAGLPFVSTDCGSVKDLSGGLVSSRETFLKSVSDLLNDRTRREQLSLEGFKEWKECFTWDVVVDKYEDLYTRLYFEKFSERRISIDSCSALPKRTTPTISIALATKNRGPQLKQMLNSLQAACGDVPYEILVLDGHSSDGTIEIVHELPNGIFFDEERELGLGRHKWSELYNFLFSKASGEFVMYASDDIVFNPGCIETAFNLIKRYRTNGVVGGIFFYKNVIAETPWDKPGIDLMIGGYLLMNYGLLSRDAIKKVGGFDNDYAFYCADTDLCFKLYSSGFDLMPIPGSSIVHQNVMDVSRKTNTDLVFKDIELYQKRWQTFAGTTELPQERRLIYVPQLREYYLAPYEKQFDRMSRISYWREMARQLASYCL